MTLSRDLAHRSDEELVALLQRRPDLVADPPLSFADLAGRLSSTPATRSAILGLDRWARDVLEAVVFLEGRATDEAIAELLTLGHDRSAASVLGDVARAVRTLRDAGLVWHDGSGNASAVEPVRVSLQRPFGFGRSFRVLAAARTRDELVRIARAAGVAPGQGERTSKEDMIELVARGYRTIESIDAALVGSPHGTKELFVEAVHAGGVRVPYTYGFSPAARHQRPDLDWLLERGLLLRSSYDVAEVPREVALVVRGRVVTEIDPAPPPADAGAVHVNPRDRDVAAASAAATVVARVEALCHLWGADPAPILRSTGGLGAREIKKVTKALNLDEGTVPFLIELASAARLVTVHVSRNDEVVMPTHLFDEWAGGGEADRWQALVEAWREVPRWLSLGGNRDNDNKLIPVLSSIASVWDAAYQRRVIVDTLASLDDSVAPTVDGLAPHVVWFAPGRWRGPAPPEVLVEWVLIEMELLGLTGHGAYVPADPAALLGAATSDVTLQADLTAIAEGALVPELASLLDDAADLESAGAAKVWRFSDASVRRALDLGRTAPAMIETLTHAATRGMPQPLEYLITDVARRHGLLRGGTASSYVTADDPALLTSAVRAKGAARLGLRLVAPTVAVANAPIAKVLDVLRAAGLSPVEEDPSGEVVVRGRSDHRAPTPPSLASRASSPSTSVVPIGSRPRRTRGMPSEPAAIVKLWREAGDDARGVR